MTPKPFWTWFQQNAQKLYIIQLKPSEEQEQFYSELIGRLNNYCEGLGYKIGFSKDFTGYATLVITAYGVKKLFPKVIELVESAPVIDNWKIEAFIKPQLFLIEDNPYRFRNIEINLKNLRFKPAKYIKSTGKVIINIYFNNPIVPTPPTNDKAAFSFSNIDLRPLFTFILEDLLGEIVLYERVKNFKIYRRYHEKEITYKLIHLKTYLDLTNRN